MSFVVHRTITQEFNYQLLRAELLLLTFASGGEESLKSACFMKHCISFRLSTSQKNIGSQLGREGGREAGREGGRERVEGKEAALRYCCLGNGSAHFVLAWSVWTFVLLFV